jgi:hypothetical protein
MKTHLPEPLGYSKGSAKRKVDSYERLHKKSRAISNKQPNDAPRALKNTNNPNAKLADRKNNKH